MNKRDQIIKMGIEGQVDWKTIAVALARNLDNAALNQIADREGWQTHQLYNAQIEFTVSVTLTNMEATDHGAAEYAVKCIKDEVERTLDTLELRDIAESNVEHFGEIDICSYHKDTTVEEV